MKPDEHGVLKSWSTVLSDAEDHQFDLVEDIYDRIEAVEMPSASCRRKGEELLVCRHRAFRDCALAIRVWASGSHITVSWRLSCRPGWLKRVYADAVTGDPYALSMPHSARDRQDFASWNDIIHTCVTAAVKELEGKLQGRWEIRRENTDVIDDW